MDSKMQEAFEKWKQEYFRKSHGFSESVQDAFEAGAAWVRAEGAEREKRLRKLVEKWPKEKNERYEVNADYWDGILTGRSEAARELEAALAPSSSDERGTMEWTDCSCDPEYAHHCVFCGGTGKIKRVLKLDERGRETP